ncbi:MAG: Calx-beta domain-containing protein, partial [Pyrinomonadaceae bacterium]
MKTVKFGGLSARRFGVRLLALTVACVLVAGALAPFGARAQQKGSGGSGKQASGTEKVAPAIHGLGKVKEGGAKSAALTGGGVTPQVLGCADTGTISFGTPINGALTSGDCKNPIDGSFYDSYTFSGTAGQQIVITMTSSQFDTYLYLMKPGETTIGDSTIQNDDISNTNTNSQIANLTLPSTGTYTILANSFAAGATGNYTLSLTGGGACTQTSTQIQPGPGPSGVVTKAGTLANGDCTRSDDGSFYDVYTYNGTAGQQIAIQMNASFDAFLFLIAPDGDELARDDDGVGGGSTNARIPAGASTTSARLPQTGTYLIIANSRLGGETGSYTLIMGLDANACPSTTINSGQPAKGSLQPGDCRVPVDSSYIDVYTFSGIAGQTISVTMTSQSQLDPYLFLLSPTGANLDEDNDGGGGTNAHLPSGKRAFTGVLPTTGIYTIYANAAVPDVAGSTGATGSYTLTLSGTTSPTATLAFSQTNYPYTEGDAANHVTLTVTRTGDLSAASSVDYATLPDNGLVQCNTNTGLASERCDYTAVRGTLSFSVGESSKTFIVPVTDDSYVEGNETFTVTLSNPVGGALGTTSSATVTITDNDGVGEPNPIDNAPFFIRQQYLDFLLREPEPEGLSFYLNILSGCVASDIECTKYTRGALSANFFRSPEFQTKGSYVMYLYMVSLGQRPVTPAELATKNDPARNDRPHYAEFMA